MYLIKHTNQSLFSRNFFKVLIIFLIVLVLVFVSDISGSVRSLAFDILSPLIKAGNFFYKSLDEIPSFFSDRNKLMKENVKLLSELEDLHRNIVDYESLEYDNQRLREELRLKPAGDYISASIVARFPQIPLDSLILDKGIREGVNNGNLVLVGQRILIGKIVESNKNKSTVALNSFARVVSYGFVARTSEPIEIKGTGGASIEAKVPIDFDIVVGDKIMVFSSSNYLVAIVGAVEINSPSGFKDVLMSLPIDTSKINVVFVEPTAQ